MPEGTLLTPGVFLGDEVTQSGDPPRHAVDLVGTMLKGAALVRAADRPGQRARGGAAARCLCQLGCGLRYVGAGPAVEGEARGGAHARLHLPHRQRGDAARGTPCGRRPRSTSWSLRLPHGVGVIFRGPWGRDQAKSRRWIERRFVAIPEAIVSENPNATIPAMLHLTAVLGWPGERTAPCFYLTRGFAASSYSGTLGSRSAPGTCSATATSTGWTGRRCVPNARALPSEQPSKQAKPEQKTRAAAGRRARRRCVPPSSPRWTAGAAGAAAALGGV